MFGMKHFFLFTIKRGSLGTEEDFKKLKKKELYRLWFVEEYFDAGLARGYNVSKKLVRQRREELGITWLGSGLQYNGGRR